MITLSEIEGIRKRLGSSIKTFNVVLDKSRR